ncbi:MAG: 2TM domain-containing protein [Actinomycetota bacterium]
MTSGPTDQVELTEEEIQKQAKKRVDEKIGLLSHIATYVIINVFLFVVWGLTSNWSGYPWFVWVIVGWGIGLAFNIFFYFSGRKGQASRDRMMAKEMDRIRKEQDK